MFDNKKLRTTKLSINTCIEIIVIARFYVRVYNIIVQQWCFQTKVNNKKKKVIKTINNNGSNKYLVILLITLAYQNKWLQLLLPYCSLRVIYALFKI